MLAIIALVSNGNLVWAYLTHYLAPAESTVIYMSVLTNNIANSDPNYAFSNCLCVPAFKLGDWPCWSYIWGKVLMWVGGGHITSHSPASQNA